MKLPEGYNAPYQNPLHLPTWMFIQKVGDLHALIHESTVLRNKSKKEAEKDAMRLIGTTTITTYDLASDLPQTLGPELNIIRPIKTKDYLNTLNNIALREAAYAITQIYEYFESFLFDMVTVYKTTKSDDYQASNSFDQVRGHLKMD